MPISFLNRASAVARTHQYSVHIPDLPRTTTKEKKRKSYTLHSVEKKKGAWFKYGTLNGTLRRQNADRI